MVSCLKLSDRMIINHGIVHGSGIRPFLYILMERNLHPLHQNNDIFKYTDDTNLSIPQHFDIPTKAVLL